MNGRCNLPVQQLKQWRLEIFPPCFMNFRLVCALKSVDKHLIQQINIGTILEKVLKKYSSLLQLYFVTLCNHIINGNQYSRNSSDEFLYTVVLHDEMKIIFNIGVSPPTSFIRHKFKTLRNWNSSNRLFSTVAFSWGTKCSLSIEHIYFQHSPFSLNGPEYQTSLDHILISYQFRSMMFTAMACCIHHCRPTDVITELTWRFHYRNSLKLNK